MSFAQKVVRITNIQILSKILELFYHIIIAYWIGATGRGETALAFLLADSLALFLSPGTDQAMVYVTSKKIARTGEAFGLSLFFSLISTLLAVPVGYYLIKYQPAFLDKTSSVVLLVALSSIPLKLLFHHLQFILQGVGKTVSAGFLYLVLSVGNLIIVLILWVSLPDYGIISVVLARTGSFILCVAASLFFLRHEKFWVNILPSKRLLVQTLSLGIRQYGEKISRQMESRLDQFLIAWLVPSTALLGCYAQGVSLAERLWILPAMIHFVALPVTCASMKGAPEFVAKSTRVSIFVTVVPAILLGVFSKPLIIILFGKEFSPSAMAVILLIPGIVMRSATRMMSAYMLSINRPGVNSWVIMGGLVVNVLLNLVMIPMWNINGASAASSISYSLEALVLVGLFCRFSGIPFWNVLVVNRSDLRKLFQAIGHALGKFRRRSASDRP